MPIQTRTNSIREVTPVIHPELAVAVKVNLGPSQTLVAGTVLGQITGSANDVQTITDVPTITAGTFTISGVNPHTGEAFTTAALAYNAATATVQAELEKVFGTGNIAVTGGPLPGTDVVLTFQSKLAAMPITLMTISSTGLTGGTLSIAKTTTGRSKGTFVAYNETGTDDGHRVAKAILRCDVTTDTLGKCRYGNAVDGWYDTPTDDAEAYVSGFFDSTKLIGLDANGVTDFGRFVTGDLSNGGVLFVR
jgi:hypothetical protein